MEEAVVVGEGNVVIIRSLNRAQDRCLATFLIIPGETSAVTNALGRSARSDFLF